MLLSEYICKLVVLLDEHGDHECIDEKADSIGDPEFNDEFDQVFILASEA